MVLQLLDRSRVFIDLRATGLLKSLAHDPTLSARPTRATVAFTAPNVPAAVEATFDVNGIEAPPGISPADREKMLDNMRHEVLDAARFPTLAFRGEFMGTLERGTLTGDLVVRGAPRPVSFAIAASPEASADGPVLVARGTWEGRLSGLGLRPYKALLGAIKLDDWVALRIEARVARPEP
jgi:hypothetical protein